MAAALEKERLFFQTYQSLEKELLEMTDYIHFTEKNLDVFSVKFANFILRANVECESMLKELYKRTEHYQLLSKEEKSKSMENSTYVEVNSVYRLDKKTIYITSENFFFEGKYSKPFIPDKFKKNKKDLVQIYNGLKHYRVNNMQRADLETAINILGLLFVLNSCFYPDLIKKAPEDRSKIFRGKIAHIEPLFLSGINKIDKLDKAEVGEYFASCIYYKWIQESELTEPKAYELNSINHMLDYHKESINLSMEEMIEKLTVNESLYETLDYPLLLSVPLILPNDGKSLSKIHDDAKKF